MTLTSALFAFAGRNLYLRRIGSALLVLGTGIGAITGALALTQPLDTTRILTVVAPFGLHFQINALAAIFFVIVNTVACIAALYAIRYVDDGGTYHIPSLGGLTSLFIVGMQLTLLAASIPTFMVAWETMSLASFVLVMADRTAASRNAAILYFVMAHIGAVAIMAGFFVLSGGNPYAAFDTFATTLPTLTQGQTLLAFILFFIGFGSKAGLVPLHTWLPAAHPQAPSHVSALMSGVMLKVAVYGFIFTSAILLPTLPTTATVIVMGIGLISAVFGALHAAVDTDIKRTLAWSSVENLGMIFLMLGTAMFARNQHMNDLATITFTAALFHCIAHAIFKSGLFMTAGSIVHMMHTRSLERMGGLAKRMPTFSASFLVLCLAAAALPPFAGFIGEWMYLTGLVAALPHAALPVQVTLALALVGTAFVAGIATFAMIKLFAISQLGAPRSRAADEAKDPSWGIRGPVFVLTASAVLAGVFATNILHNLGFMTPSASTISLPSGTVSPLILAVIATIMFALVLTSKRIFGLGRERDYQTWNCGQPITAQMEYTATAFSAPFRFFFRSILGIRKTVAITPSAGGLVARREMLITGRSFLESHVHEPIARGLHMIADRIKRVQSGSIQLYLLFILIALGVTLIIAV